MFHPKYIILLFFALLVVAWACNPVSPVNKTAREITESLRKNDLQAAKTCANRMSQDKFDLANSSVQDLCAIAISLMKLSETDSEEGDYAAQALKFYDMAIMKDSVATHRYFDMIGPEDYNSVNLLRQLRDQIRMRESHILDYHDEYEQ